ncbi:MAG: BlaI/MecI/CopY family transcriptional regulator [Clostridiales bacterium]|nr:BlaI/MecI/CopY family transcriptional regulator [Clostridiales bacterium]
MREKAALTDAEMKIMLRLWDRHPQTMMELTRALESETHWSKYTVITLLKRMEAKGTITVDESGPAKTYAPAVKKADFAREQTHSLVRDLYGGSATLLVSGLVENGAISQKELDELMEMLRKAKS